MADAKIYTKTGDEGSTSLVGGTRVQKDHPRIECYGSVDELNSSISLAIISMQESVDLKKLALKDQLQEIQHKLFNIGSILAAETTTIAAKLPHIEEQDLLALERQIDFMNEELAPLKNFILPGGCLSAAHLHMSRCICRRTERLAVNLQRLESLSVPSLLLAYLNRLSDFLFISARYVNLKSEHPDILWKK